MAFADARRKLELTISGLDGTGPAISSVQRRLRGLRRSAARTRSALQGMATGFGLGTVGAISGIATLGFVAAKAVKIFATFEASMSRVRGLTGASAGEMRRLTEVAETMGLTTQFSANQAALAMATFAKSGFKANEIVGSMNPTLGLAAVGMISISDATDILTNAMRGMRIPLEDLPITVDILAKAASQANTTVAALGESMARVGPVAGDLGIPFEEVTAALMIMQNAGIEAQISGTSLRNILLKLSEAPTTVAGRRLKELGIDVIDPLTGKMKNLVDIFQQLNAATADMTAVERTGALAGIFGVRPVVGLQRLLGEKDFGGVAKGLKDTGYAASQTATFLDNLSGDATKLSSAFNQLLKQLGEGVVPRKIVQGITEAVRGVGEGIETADRQFADSPLPGWLHIILFRSFFTRLLMGQDKAQQAESAKRMFHLPSIGSRNLPTYPREVLGTPEAFKKIVGPMQEDERNRRLLYEYLKENDLLMPGSTPSFFMTKNVVDKKGTVTKAAIEASMQTILEHKGSTEPTYSKHQAMRQLFADIPFAYMEEGRERTAPPWVKDPLTGRWREEIPPNIKRSPWRFPRTDENRFVPDPETSRATLQRAPMIGGWEDVIRATITGGRTDVVRNAVRAWLKEKRADLLLTILGMAPGPTARKIEKETQIQNDTSALMEMVTAGIPPGPQREQLRKRIDLLGRQRISLMEEEKDERIVPGLPTAIDIGRQRGFAIEARERRQLEQLKEDRRQTELQIKLNNNVEEIAGILKQKVEPVHGVLNN